MSSLAQYQKQFADAVRGIASGRGLVSQVGAIKVHRNTVFGALHSALSQSYPTLKKLTGPDYFRELVTEFIRAHPPSGASLYEYGELLPKFVQTFPGCEPYPYFSEVARFDWTVDQSAHRGPGGFFRAASTTGGVLCLASTLQCMQFDFCVDDIRTAVESDDESSLRSLDVSPKCRRLAIWNTAKEVRVRPLSDKSWTTLRELTAGWSERKAPRDAKLIAEWDISEEIRASSFAYWDRTGGVA